MKSTQVPHPLRKSVLTLSRAVALLCIAAPGFSQAQVELKPVEISGAKQTLQAADTALSQSTLEARSAQSIVSDEFIRNYTSPVADYTQALTMTPGVFGYTANGVGLGDSKITMRGLSDSFMVISFDGIPFNDTNGVRHWVVPW
jgi:iron complex outermembrane receptor protein